MADKGAQMLESLIRLWAHQNNQEIEELKIWKKGESEENAKIMVGSSGACSCIGGMYCSSTQERA